MEDEKQQGEPQENGKSAPAPAEKEVTKRTIRVQTWKRFAEHKCAAPPLDVFNKIPNFKGAEQAASLLTELDEFKKATHIKVNMDRAQEHVKLAVLKAGKNLYVPPGRDAEVPSLFTQVICPEEEDIKMQKKIVRLQGGPETKKEIGLDTNVKLDILVVGSCAVSKLGQRIGKGNGYVDLDVGLLTHLNVITKDTTIITTVHDVQVYDELPAELFKKYDLPLDIIVTPTEVIRVSKRLPRPSGLDWSLLSQRRVNLIPVLTALKEKEEKAGKTIALKEEDTDVESTRKPRQRPNRRMMRRKRKPRRSEGGDNAESNTETEEVAKPHRRRRYGRTRKERNSENQNGADSEGGEGKEDAAGGKKKNKERRRQNSRRLENRDLCIKISNIAKNVRIKDLKAELREKSCHPTFISWKGGFGKCYLHFAKKRDQDEEKVTEEILKALDSLSFNIKFEVVKRKQKSEGGAETDGDGDGENRIETTDVTSV